MSERNPAIGVRHWATGSPAEGAILGGVMASHIDLRLAVETPTGDVADGEVTLAAVALDGRLTTIGSQGTPESSHA